MAWLDDRLRDHPKIVKATPAAFKVWVLALCYCSAHGTAGRLDEAIRALNTPQKVVDELVKLALWDREPDGLWVHDWQEHNTQRDAKNDERKAQARERARRYRARVRGENPDTEPNPHDQQDDPHRDVTRDDRVTVTRDVRVTERDAVTRDAVRDASRAGARSRSRSTQEEPPAAADGQRDAPAAAAQTIERLQALELDPAQLTPYGDDISLIDAWLDVADSESHTNPAGFVLAGVRSGRLPSPRTRAQTLDPVARRRSFVAGDGWRLPADELEFQLGELGASEGELVGLLELAADLRRGAAA